MWGLKLQNYDEGITETNRRLSRLNVFVLIWLNLSKVTHSPKWLLAWFQMALNQEKCPCGRTQFKCKACEVIPGQWTQKRPRKKNLFFFPHGFSGIKTMSLGDIRPNHTISMLFSPENRQTEVVSTHRSVFVSCQDEVNNLLSLLPSFDKRRVSGSAIDLLPPWARWPWRDILHVL